jgi:hypothetical protein
MNPPIWTEIDFRLSVVRRWQVMPTIRTQTVAEHQHNVCKLAERLATDVFGWDIDDPKLLALLRIARDHDDLEAVIGDPPSYTKPYVDEAAMSEQFAALMREPIYDDVNIPPDITFIVKAADYIDAAIFLRVEISMGNKTVVPVLRDLERRFRDKCDDFYTEWGNSRWQMDARNAYTAYARVVDTMFNGNGQLSIEGFRF